MDDFIPSEDFVEQTMKKVHGISIAQGPQQFSAIFRFNRNIITFGYLAASLLFGLFNLVRLYLCVFAPASCH